MSDDVPLQGALQPHRRQSASSFVMEHLFDLIDNELSPGDQLPPQRELAERLNVSLPSVRESLAALQAIGLIDVRHGRGMFVSERPALGTLLRTLTSVLMREVSFEELFAVRRTIELEVCRDAALKGSPEDKQDLLDRCEVMRAAPSSAEFTAADIAFHLAIARTAGNRLWVQMLDMVRTMLQSALLALPEERELSTRQHDAMARAIADGDAERAVAEMQAHVAINQAGLEALKASGAVDGISIWTPPAWGSRS